MKAVIYDNKICVPASELIKNTTLNTGFFSKGTYDAKVNRGQLIVARRGCRGVPALIEFESMDMKTKQQYIESYGDPREEMSRMCGNLLEQELSMSLGDEAYKYYMSYIGDGGAKLTAEKISLYTLQARVLDACLRIRDRKRREIGRGPTKINVWERLSEMVNELGEMVNSRVNLVYQHKLPGSASTLKRKADGYEKGGYEALINKNLGNKSASKIRDDYSEAIMGKLLAVHMNLNSVQIMTEYNKVARQMGISEIKSPVTVDNYRKKYESTTLGHRRGSKTFKNKLEMQIKRSAPETAMTYWTLDGWTVELLYQKQEMKLRKVNGIEKKYRVTTYTNRKTMVVVLDTCAKYPIGYAIGDNESPALIREALRNAVNHTRELFGRRYKPIQMQSDNYQKKVMVPFYEAMTRYYTPAALGNAKSKIIEPYFNYLNETFCKMLPNFSGYGITSNKEHQPNLEILNVNHKLIPTEEEVVQQIHAIIAQEREKKAPAYMEAWERTPAERRIEFGDEEYLMLMGETTGRTNRLTGQGLKIEIGGKAYTYESADLTLRDHYNEDWVVHFDPTDDRRVLICNAEATKGHRVSREIGNLRYMMDKDVVIPMALVDQTDEHFEHRKRVRDFNKELERRYIDANERRDELISEIRERIPDLQNNRLLDRALLVDSMGQHKDVRSEERSEGRTMAMIEDFENARKPVWSDDDDYEFDPTDMNFSR